MNFSEVLIYMRDGKSVCRSGWNGKDILVYLYRPDVDTLTHEQLENDTIINPHFRIWNKKQKTIDTWVPSVSDCLACDWMFYKEGEEWKCTTQKHSDLRLCPYTGDNMCKCGEVVVKPDVYLYMPYEVTVISQGNK